MTRTLKALIALMPWRSGKGQGSGTKAHAKVRAQRKR